MKVVLVQYDVQIEKVEENMNYVSNLLSPLTSEDSIDLVLLPECAFSGYVYSNIDHIRPHLEYENGRTFEWCKKEAIRINSHIIAGFPEKKNKKNEETQEIEEIYYNSIMLVSPTGELITTYHKHFLYETDHRWCIEGPSFLSFYCQSLGCQVGLGICMDINNYEFKSDWNLFEFSNYQKENKSQVIFFSANWILSERDHQLMEENIKSPKDISNSAIQYWGSRLYPLLGTDCVFLAANRIGLENGTRFVGSSCAIDLKKKKVIDFMDVKKEGFIIVQFDVSSSS